VAAVVFLLLVALLTPFGLRDAVSAGVEGYAAVMGAMAALAALLLLVGYKLRARATQLDRDRD
jgi:fumarate reductase subunit D